MAKTKEMATSEPNAAEKPKNKKSAYAKGRQCGLTFPVSMVLKQLRKLRHLKREILPVSAVYLTAVLEYLAAEILELAGNAAQDNKRARITPRHIQLAVRHDEELSKLFENVTIAAGGVIPNILPVLLPKSSKREA